MNPLLRTVVLSLAVSPAAMVCADESPKADPRHVEFFEKRVRPVLVENCLGCHGEKKQEGGLRLDSRASALKGGDSGAVLLPGKPDESDLIAAINYDGALRMPPKQKLSAEAIAALTEWVRLGLPWPESATPGAAKALSVDTHWAFRSVAAVAPPQVRDAKWPQTDIDRFTLAKLEAHNLHPSQPADRLTLIRRASFDLIGLPPTPAEVAAFESDPAPTRQAFASLVDRLLDSPHYGERWGRYWLDVARYADNKGYVFFEEQSYPWAYAYRDWVVRAFNEDLPYDRFLLQQLAADQVSDASDRQSLAALGFLTVGGHFMNNINDIFDDRIDVVSRGLLGLTVTCARCHDHKYDPIGQADYYSLYGVFRSATEPIVPPPIVPVAGNEGFEHYELGLAERKLRLERFLAQKYDELISGARTRIAEYLLAAHASRDQPTTEDFMLLIPEGDLHPMIVQRYWHYLQKTRRQHDPVWAVWNAFAAIPEAEFTANAPEVHSKLVQWRDPAKPLNRLVVEAVCSKPPASMKEVAERYAELLNRVEKQSGEPKAESRSTGASNPGFPLSAFNLSDTTLPAVKELHMVFHAPDAPANVPKVTGWGVLTLLPDRKSQADYQKLLKELEQWMIHGPEAPPRAMVLVDDAIPFEPRIFLRGNSNRPGDSVPRRFLKVLDTTEQPFSHGGGRLDLARAIVDPKNPLTARVLVNRVWMHHFGAGLVKTPADFGIRSEPPSHPELLDSLVATFVQSGWSIKKLHRTIMRSSVYQQSSRRGIQDSGFRGRMTIPLWGFRRKRSTRRIASYGISRVAASTSKRFATRF